METVRAQVDSLSQVCLKGTKVAFLYSALSLQVVAVILA